MDVNATYCTMLTIDRLIKLKGIVKWNAVFCEAGLNPNTMRSAVHNRRELRRDEVAAILRVLRRYGISLDAPVEPTLFAKPNAESIT